MDHMNYYTQATEVGIAGQALERYRLALPLLVGLIAVLSEPISPLLASYQQ